MRLSRGKHGQWQGTSGSVKDAAEEFGVTRRILSCILSKASDVDKFNNALKSLKKMYEARSVDQERMKMKSSPKLEKLL